MSLHLQPITIGDARKFVEREHSHLHAPTGGLCAVAVSDGSRIVCVAMLSRPSARLLQASGRCAEINRVASDGSTPHAASKAIAALSRAGLALGYRRLVSSILLGEAGTSYRAAGWWPTHARERGDEEWTRAGRVRGAAVQSADKVRWEFGPDAMPLDSKVDELVRATAGKIELRDRRETLPLLARMVAP